MDKIKCICNNCGTAYLIPSTQIGNQGHCCTCHTVFTYNPASATPSPGPGNGFNGQSANAYNPQSTGAPQTGVGGGSTIPPGIQPQAGYRPGFSQGLQAEPGPSNTNVPPAQGFQPGAGYNAASPPLRPAAPGQGGFGPAAATVNGAAAAQEFKKWSEGTLVTNTRCPRCGAGFPIARSYIDKSVACPKCRKPFFVAENYGWLVDPNASFMSRLFSHQYFYYIVGGFFVLLLVLNITVPMMLNSWAGHKLKNVLKETYRAPDYEINIVALQKNKELFRNKTPDGLELCERWAVASISHPKSGMEFPRSMCQYKGRWTPDFTQTIADQTAYQNLDNPFAEQPFDVGEMVGGVVNHQAQNWKDTFAKNPEEMAAFEAKLIAARSGPAIENMTKLGHDQETSKSWQDIHGDSDEDSFASFDDGDFQPSFSYWSSFYDRYDLDLVYKAHAVMYPNQAQELSDRGLLKELP